jgi:hypothetical protein
MNGKLISIAAAIVFIGCAAQAGTENVKFPKGYAENYVLYTTVNKPSKKRGDTFRKFYINKSALAAVKAGKTLPSGSVLVREDWFTKKDASNKSIKGADGNFITAKKKGVVVMEKRDGWGAEYPVSKRNGNWEYAAFRVNGDRNPKAKIGRCFGCHMRKKSADFVFTMKALRKAAK